MKQPATFNQIFASVRIGCWILLLCILSTPGTVFAAIDFSAVLHNTYTNAVTVTVKNNGPTGVDGGGQYNSVLYVKATAIKVSDQSTVSVGSPLSIIGGETKELSIAGLAPNTAYSIIVSAEESSTHEIKTITITVTTQKSQEQTQPPKALYVSFIPGQTVVTSDSIKVGIRSNGTKTFITSVTVKDAAGTAQTRTVPIAAGTTIGLSFFNLTPDTSYSLSLTGTEEGSNAPFRTTTYDGGVRTAKVPAPPQVPATGSGSTQPVAPAPVTTVGSKGSCVDNIDNDGDGRADWDGGYDAAGALIPPDPSCINKDSIETPDDVAENSLIPCTDKCDLSSVFGLLNKLIDFLIKFLLFPVAILMFVYAGFKYITAEGNPSKKANVKKMMGHLIGGIVIMLTAWVVVKTLLVVVGYDQTLYFFD